MGVTDPASQNTVIQYVAFAVLLNDILQA